MCLLMIMKKLLSNKRNKNSQKRLTQQHKNPYVILDVTRRSTLREIQDARKHILKKYHPDLLAGFSDEFIHTAEDRCKNANWAYTTLKKKHKKKNRTKRHAA